MKPVGSEAAEDVAPGHIGSESLTVQTPFRFSQHKEWQKNKLNATEGYPEDIPLLEFPVW